MTYYFIKDGENELGPFTVSQLKSKSIKKNTPVWFAGLQEWIHAGQVYELNELFTEKLPSRSLSKSIIYKLWDINLYKIWDINLLKQPFKKVS